MFAENLKILRKTLHLSVDKMAEETGTPASTIWGYEGNKRTPSVEFPILLNRIYNVNLNWLLSDQGDMFISNCENTLVKTDNKAVSSNIFTFHKRLNKLQSKNELNDYELSKLLDISESRIEKLGIGKSLPELEELNKIKANFDVSIDWLLYGETPQKRSQDDEPTLTSEEINILKKLASKQII